jgi:hypothetical protein
MIRTTVVMMTMISDEHDARDYDYDDDVVVAGNQW